ncbi:hypothetical protein [Mesorhizobium sp. LjNodule214]|uniref:hypothetical protein n=1 Tax=Mesorhizobium sp. LjNodule214 TaxID=3342252 RepID=UPI003ED0FD3C
MGKVGPVSIHKTKVLNVRRSRLPVWMASCVRSAKALTTFRWSTSRRFSIASSKQAVAKQIRLAFSNTGFIPQDFLTRAGAGREIHLMHRITTPFGGFKSSGFGGRDNGIHAPDKYTRIKTSWLDLTGDADEAVA